jgi:hypothetical protein
VKKQRPLEDEIFLDLGPRLHETPRERLEDDQCQREIVDGVWSKRSLQPVQQLHCREYTELPFAAGAGPAAWRSLAGWASDRQSEWRPPIARASGEKIHA